MHVTLITPAAGMRITGRGVSSGQITASSYILQVETQTTRGRRRSSTQRWERDHRRIYIDPRE